MALEIHLGNFVTRTHRMQLRPVIEILKSIIGTVIGAPSEDGLKPAAVIKILSEKLTRGRDVLGKELTLQLGPPRCSHRCIDGDSRSIWFTYRRPNRGDRQHGPRCDDTEQEKKAVFHGLILAAHNNKHARTFASLHVVSGKSAGESFSLRENVAPRSTSPTGRSLKR